MRSATLLMFLLLAGLCFPQCFVQKCVSEGDTCDAQDCTVAGSTACTKNCPLDEVCNGSNGESKCTSKTNGRKCDFFSGFGCTAPAADPLSYICFFGECKPLIHGVGVANDYCDISTECLDDLNCVNGRCQGLDLNADCSADGSGSCTVDAYCRSADDKCRPMQALGANCTTSDQCYLSTCANGICSALYVLAEGDSCSSDSQCGLNLYCDGGLCRSVFEPSGAACDGGTPCVNNKETCRCSTETGTQSCQLDSDVLNAPCNALEQKLNRCLIDNGCSESSSFSNEKSCAYVKCKDEQKDVEKCKLKRTDQYRHPSCRSPAATMAGTGLLAILF